MTFQATSGLSITKCVAHLIGYAIAYILLGTITSLAATFFGFFFLLFLLAGPDGVISTIFPLVPLIGLPVGFILSLPVTFLTLPLIAICLKHRPVTHLLVSISGGAATGAVTVLLWQSRGFFPKFSDPSLLLIAGSTAGLVAGMIYASFVRNLRR